MKFCPPCWRRAHDENHYLGADDEMVPTEAECMVHPRADNWRVWRTLSTIQHFAMQPVGWRDRRCPTPITLEEGWVHRRNLEVIVFDYERALIDFLIREGHVDEDERHAASGITTRAVRITKKGTLRLNQYIAQRQQGASA